MRKIVAVVVTYNRITTLKIALAAYDNQIVPFSDVIVVDNKSSDDTNSYLKEWKSINAGYNKHILSLSENLGGSGGFYAGQEYAMSLNADWIFVADDDAYPANDLVKRFTEIVRDKQSSQFGAICTTVRYPNNEITYQHRSHIVYKHWVYMKDVNSTPSDYLQNSFSIDLFSYVGTFLNSLALSKYGLCNKEFFIYLDDTEHSFRVRKFGPIMVYPELEVIHEGGLENSKTNLDVLLSWRTYYSIRNNIYVMRRYYNFITRNYYMLNLLLYYHKKYHKNKECKRLYLTAFFDGFFKRLGKHVLYKPPYCIRNSK